MKDFRDLHVWVGAHELTLKMYSITAGFPREERFGLTAQLRRSSASIGANIAEGCGKRGNAEFQKYLQIASGSASELDYHLILARDLGFLKKEAYDAVFSDLVRVRRMLAALIQKVESERQLAKC